MNVGQARQARQDKKALGRNSVSSQHQLMPIAKHSLLELVAALEIMLRCGPGFIFHSNILIRGSETSCAAINIRKLRTG